MIKDMKKILIICLSIFVVFATISSCKTDENIDSFSYEEHCNSFINDSSIGIQKDGFRNTTETSISTSEQAINIAKNEVTIEYNQTEAFYDKECDMYMVAFYTEGMLGGCQNVYMNSEGITKLIIYGE